MGHILRTHTQTHTHTHSAKLVVRIVKDKCKNISDAGNYRPIALSSELSKVFDLILLSKLNSYFCTTDYQFGFKSHHSTDLCIYSKRGY